MDANGDGTSLLHSVLACDLGLAIRSHPRAGSVLADLSQAGAQRGGELMGEGHERLGLVGGVTEHDALVAGSDVLELLCVDGLGDVGTLLLDGHNHVASAVIKTCSCKFEGSGYCFHESAHLAGVAFIGTKNR